MRYSSRADDRLSANCEKIAPSESTETRVAPTFLHGVLDAREQRAEVEARRRSTVSTCGSGDASTNAQLALALPLRRCPSRSCACSGGCRAPLLEGDEDAVLVAVANARGEELHGEHGLAAAGGAGDERRAILGQPALGDEVEAGMPVGIFSTASSCSGSAS